MNIHFTLRSQGKIDPKIVLRVFDGRFHLRNFMYSTGLSIKSDRWDKRKNRAKAAPGKIYEDEIVKLNLYLDRLEKETINFLSEHHNSITLNRSDLKSHLQKLMLDDQKILSIYEQKESEFFDLWEKLIASAKNPSTGEPITLGTKRSKNQTFNLIKEYSIKRNLKLSFDSIDMNFYHDFDNYLTKQGLNSNTRGKHFKEIKAILREAEDRNLEVNGAFRKKSFKVIRTKPDNVYLNDHEIKKIFNLQLSPSQEKLRDIFVMACYVGARHSDWDQIHKENIIVEGEKRMLRIKQTKTGELIHIPIHSAVDTIMAKYQNDLPTVITNQKFNEALKTICKKAELGKVKIGKETVEKWEQISTHTARRSFATNAYLSRAMDVYQIMKCTGHKTESSFLRYLKLDGKDFAIQAADSKFFKDDSWNVMKVAS